MPRRAMSSVKDVSRDMRLFQICGAGPVDEGPGALSLHDQARPRPAPGSALAHGHARQPGQRGQISRSGGSEPPGGNRPSRNRLGQPLKQLHVEWPAIGRLPLFGGKEGRDAHGSRPRQQRQRPVERRALRCDEAPPGACRAATCIVAARSRRSGKAAWPSRMSKRLQRPAPASRPPARIMPCAGRIATAIAATTAGPVRRNPPAARRRQSARCRPGSSPNSRQQRAAPGPRRQQAIDGFSSVAPARPRPIQRGRPLSEISGPSRPRNARSSSRLQARR